MTLCEMRSTECEWEMLNHTINTAGWRFMKLLLNIWYHQDIM